MAFEVQTKRHFVSRFDGHGEEPCVFIDQMVITFNRCFCQTFGFKPKTGILVLYDKKAKLVGFRCAINASEQDAACKFVAQGNGGVLNCSRFTQRKIDQQYVGLLYKASLDSVSHIITINLEEPIS